MQVQIQPSLSPTSSLLEIDFFNSVVVFSIEVSGAAILLKP